MFRKQVGILQALEKIQTINQEEDIAVKGFTQLSTDSQFTFAWRSGETFA